MSQHMSICVATIDAFPTFSIIFDPEIVLKVVLRDAFRLGLGCVNANDNGVYSLDRFTVRIVTKVHGVRGYLVVNDNVDVGHDDRSEEATRVLDGE